MDISDVITVFVLVATIISSHLLASKSIRKTKKAEWVDRLSILVSEVVSKSIALTPKSSRSEYEKLSKKAILLLLILDEDKKMQKQLNQIITELIVIIAIDENQLNNKIFEERVPKIIKLTKEIVKDELRKI
jgi:hypothetical protein